ncbi:MarR family winged helix-turn-helix transcriptional regulator [Pseudogemmobacter blasticus]|uniref:MarR family transcriptional regulator n=1 Tax=Fuscovulum blasticum DSM 2131 TaxID=1188250 RepID=A0A2T4JEI7_FUSBL|nr:MarR family transcriptional regulator [Fuscovulum blasticum]PTE16319.1 MarR family transcriptional regulator [Fuscovulum blasticum DSM 2131]
MALAPPDMLCFALHSAAHAMHAAYAPLLEPLGLTYPQYLALSALAARGDQTVSELGADLRLESNTLTPLLKRMEAAGWLSRRRDDRDERQVRLSLTDEGRALAERAAGVPRAFGEKTGLDLAEITDLRDILSALRDRLKPARG